MLKRFPEILPKLVPGVIEGEDPAPDRKGLVGLSVSYSHAHYKAPLRSRKSVFVRIKKSPGLRRLRAPKPSCDFGNQPKSAGNLVIAQWPRYALGTPYPGSVFANKFPGDSLRRFGVFTAPGALLKPQVEMT